MKDLIIIGAGGLGREVSWLVEGINEANPEWNILGYVDDAEDVQGAIIGGQYPVLGKIEDLKKYAGEVYVSCAIAKPSVRKMIIERVLQQENLQAATLIHPSAFIGRGVKIGKGCIITHMCLLSVDVELQDHVFLNTGVVIGHDTVVEEYCTIMTNTNLAGCIRVGAGTDMGTATRVIPGVKICPNVVTGAGAVVIRDIMEPGTYVGVPVRKAK